MEMPNIIPFMQKESRPLRILAVDDNRIERMFMLQQIKELGHDVLEAENGQQAIDILHNKDNHVDIVLIDRIMPILDGLSVVIRMKDDATLKKIPVIMITGAGSNNEMREGIDAGVFYYLTKPVSADLLRSVLTAASRESKRTIALNHELRRHSTSFNLIDTCKFNIRTIEDAECLSAFIALCFPEPDRVLKGLAELMVNAVEHGLYKVGYEKKGALIESGKWREELDRLSALPEYIDSHVEVVMTRKDNGIYVIVTDPGDGFNWKKYMTIEPARASDNHGRGIAQANAESFDKIAYNEKGNQVIAYVNKTPKLAW